MKSCKVNLNTLEKVKKFVSEVSKSESHFSLICGNYSVDAASVLGILSLDLSKPINLVVQEDDSEIPENILAFTA